MNKHRELWSLYYGIPCPKGWHIHHIGYDNAKKNLALVSPKEHRIIHGTHNCSWIKVKPCFRCGRAIFLNKNIPHKCFDYPISLKEITKLRTAMFLTRELLVREIEENKER